MNKLISICVLCLLATASVFSQTGNDVDRPNRDSRFIPASPTVTELGKYGMIPVSHYTGVPDISIPIYTLECGSLQLPITLTYHASGIKVDDIASWVGLGWSLNAGGVINANIIGKTDFTDIRVENIRNGNFSPTWDILNAITHANVDVNSDNWTDTQPDIFTYNFNGHSGQFVLDDGFGVHDLKGNKTIRIKANRLDTTFTITDENGTEFQFSTLEITKTTTYSLGYDNTHSFGCDDRLSPLGSEITGMVDYVVNLGTTGWFINKMISANKTDTISFFYENETTSYLTSPNAKLCQYVTGGNAGVMGVPASVSHIQNNTKRLKRIEANNGAKIVFYADNEREDLVGGKRLDRIILYYGNAGVRRWDFAYSYFESDFLHPRTNSQASQYAQFEFYKYNKRLRLSAFSENTTKNWKFHYFGDDAGEHKMPFRTSYAGKDHWGYFNSAVTADWQTRCYKYLFPKIDLPYKVKFFNVFGTTPRECIAEKEFNVPFVGVDKSPNAEYMQTYTLKSIEYPTGGYTEFQYEPHDYSRVGSDTLMAEKKQCGGLRIKEIKSYVASTSQPITKKYRYNMMSAGMLDSYPEISSGTYLTELQYIHLKTRLTRRIEICYPGGDSYSYTQKVCLPYRHPDDPDVFSSTTDITYDDILEFSSTPYTSLYSYGGDYIGYSYVTEEDNTGYTVYNFYSLFDAKNINDFSNDYVSEFAKKTYNSAQLFYSGTFPLYQPHPLFSYIYGGKCYGRGLLKNKYTFDKNNQLMFEERNNYLFVDEKKIYGMEFYRHPRVDIETNGFISNDGLIHGYLRFSYNKYFHQTGHAILTEKTIRTHDTSGLNWVQTKTEYDYNSYNQIKTQVTTSSDFKPIQEEYKYPSDFPVNPYSEMVTKNILAPVIENITTTDGKEVKRVKTEYVKNSVRTNNMILPDSISTIYLGVNSSNADILYDLYDPKGSVRQYTTLDGISTTLLWGYKHNYPIAEIKNATFSQVTAFMSENQIDRIANDWLPSNTDWAVINDLRVSLPNAQVTSFTYDPLVGIMTITDPRGIKTEYEYDELLRLISVRHDGKIVNEYDYNYNADYISTFDFDYTDTYNEEEPHITGSSLYMLTPQTKECILTLTKHGNVGTIYLQQNQPSELDIYAFPAGQDITWKVKANVTSFPTNPAKKEIRFLNGSNLTYSHTIYLYDTAIQN
jgi:YD repeat-containing protein